MGTEERIWRIGDVATATGLTVRALHHYDRIGLVVASGRTVSGHRLYTNADLKVLYQVTAMRQLGLSLEQIGKLLAQDLQVRGVIDEQLAQVDRQIRAAKRLREQLLAAREAEGGEQDDGTGLLEIIKLTHDLAGYLSQEQIEAMQRRMTDLGIVAEHAVGVEMPRLYADALEELRAGTPSSDPVVRRIVDRLDELSSMIRGADASIGAAVRQMWLDRGERSPEQSGGEWGALVAYLDEARAGR
ncbi:MerR family transcriptional regulator [Actinospica robiniae]|uniref:MerR family transcriptional regulator n=1 Tax=Actinospica robiniae TaxID=304901 RepID=UPI00040B15D4|nr:MerR family transcriptional regulator [Actinospica robiniae]